jgi:hypothetical protein
MKLNLSNITNYKQQIKQTNSKENNELYNHNLNFVVHNLHDLNICPNLPLDIIYCKKGNYTSSSCKLEKRKREKKQKKTTMTVLKLNYINLSFNCTFLLFSFSISDTDRRLDFHLPHLLQG